MIPSFYLMNVRDEEYLELYTVEFIVNNNAQSLLTIGVVQDTIQSIDCHPVYPSTKIRLIEDRRRENRISFTYGGEYFPEGRILHMLSKACDEYDEYIEAMTSKSADEF